MTLTRQEITDIANGIGLTPAIFHAFIEVESGGHGFDQKTGKIVIQFEPHIFARYLDQYGIKYTMSSVNRKYTIKTDKGVITNGVEGQVSEWIAFSTAFKINQKAALLSTSIGLSQVMGFNHAKLGYATVNEMWDDFKTGEYAQVKGMANFIKNTRGLLDALKRKDWHRAAYLYNGPAYAKHKYHIKLEKAYNKYA